MISILTDENHPRLSYTAELIFGILLGLEFEIITNIAQRSAQSECLLAYGSSHHQADLTIPSAGILFEDELRKVNIDLEWKDQIPYLFHTDPPPPKNRLFFDAFSAVFFLVSEYEKYVHKEKDSHGRYVPSAYFPSRENAQNLPLAHIYANAIWDFISGYCQSKAEKGSFKVEVTFDIDHPWKYQYKHPFVQWGGIIKDIIRKDREGIEERLGVMFKKGDPHQQFDRIFNYCSPANTTFFLLLNRTSKHDGRFTYKHKKYRELIRTIIANGYKVGIHPSYHSYLNKDLTVFELEKLAAISNRAIDHSRQHFLRYRLPETYRHLIEAGIRYDYTICDFEKGGFPTGMAKSYPWFDLIRNSKTDLYIRPTHLMDVTLAKYLNLSPKAGLTYAKELIQHVENVNGTFTLLLHNDCLSESGLWKGWRNVFQGLLQHLSMYGVKPLPTYGD